MSLINLSLVLVAGINIGMAIIILLRNYKSKINISFALTILFLGAWSMGEALFRQASTEMTAFFWARTENTVGFFIAVCFFFFALYYPYERVKLKYLHKILLGGVMVSVVCVIWSPYYIVQILLQSPDNDFISRIEGRVFFTFIFLFFVISALYSLVKKYASSQGAMRRDLLSIIIATGITSSLGAYFGMIVTLFNGRDNAWFAPYFSIPMVIILAWFVFKKT